MRPPSAPNPRLGWIAAGITAFIVYGSLFPFAFHPNPVNPLRALLETWNTPAHRSDVIANILLYLPLGFALTRSIFRLRPWTAAAMAAGAGTLLSASLEMAQLYVAGRQTALSDVLANAAGTLLGAAAAAAAGDRFRLPGLGWLRSSTYVAFVLSCWLGYRLFPYVPVIDLHKYWHAVRPLVVAPSLPLPDLYRHAAVWLGLALLVEALAGARRSRVVVAGLAAAVTGLRILIAGAALSPAELLGAAAGVALWGCRLWRMRARAGMVAILFAGAVVLQALAPYHFGPRHAFDWVPFAGFLQSSLANAAPSFLEKMFTYSALVWLLARAGWRPGAATVSSAVLVFGLRLVQMWLPGRSAEIGDCLLVLAAGLLLKCLDEDPRKLAG